MTPPNAPEGDDEIITIPAAGNAAQTNLSAGDKIRHEALLWILSIASALAHYGIVALVTLSLYNPDIEALNNRAKELFFFWTLAIPEPMETMLFRLGVITVIPSMALFYWLYSRMKWVGCAGRQRTWYVIAWLAVAVIAALIILDFSAANPPGGTGKRLPALSEGARNNNFNFFFDGFFIGDYLWVYACIVVPLVAAWFFVGMRKYHWDTNRLLRLSGNTVGYIVIGGAVAAIVAMNTFAFPYSNDNKYDFNAVYYSMTQVYAGAPLLVNGFTNTYGLYPHFLNPLFHVIGLDVLKFSATMSIMLGLSFVMNFYVLRKIVSNRMLLFLGFASMLFFSYFVRKLTTLFDCYFALFPVRYVVPSLLLMLASIYFFKPRVWLYWTIYVVMACLVLWNPEIGIACYIAWMVANIYNDFYLQNGKVNFRRIVMHVAAGPVLLFCVFFTYKLLIFATFGDAPDMSLLWHTMNVFGTGFMCLPMTPLNPWNIFALIIVAGFFHSIRKWCRKEVSPKSTLVLLLSLISLGYLFYFQGRSHNVTLESSTSFCILLFTVLCDDLWQTIKQQNLRPLNALFVVMLFLISFSFIDLVADSGRIANAVTQEDDKAIAGYEQNFLANNRTFFLANTQEHERVLLLCLSKFQGLYFDGDKRLSAFNPGIIDMFLKSEVSRLEDVVRDSSFKIFLEPALFNYFYMRRVLGEVGALYQFKKASSIMCMLEKRKIRIPADSFFTNTPDLVAQRKYKDDPAGLYCRIRDCDGLSPIVITPEFSVQAFFYSTPQVYQYPVIVSNSSKQAGFAITGDINSAEYIFIVNGVEHRVKLQHNQWMYCVMNVYTDHMDVFANGELVKSFTLTGPVIRSDDPLFIGNMNGLHYFVGAISEVAIADAPLTTEQIRETWQKISAVNSGGRSAN